MKAGKEMKVEFEERQMARDLEAAAEAGALVSKANAITNLIAALQGFGDKALWRRSPLRLASGYQVEQVLLMC